MDEQAEGLWCVHSCVGVEERIDLVDNVDQSKDAALSVRMRNVTEARGMERGLRMPSWEVSGNLEICEAVPNTSLICCENNEVLRFYGAGITLVRDRESTTAYIGFIISMEGSSWGSRTRIVAILNITSRR